MARTRLIRTNPEESWTESKNGMPKVTRVRLWEGTTKGYVFLDLHGRRGLIQRAGCMIESRAMDELASEWLKARWLEVGSLHHWPQVPTAYIRKFINAYDLGDEYSDWEDEEFIVGLLEDFIKEHCDPQLFIKYIRKEAQQYAESREENEVDEEE